MKRHLPYWLGLLGVMAVVVAACASAGQTPTATPAPIAVATATSAPTAVPTATVVPVQTKPPTTEPTTPSAETQLASGEAAYGVYCGSCHGAAFSVSGLRRYRTAAGLFQYLRSSMPPDNPDAVPEQKAYDIVAYMLFKAGVIKADQPVNADTASSLSIQ